MGCDIHLHIEVKINNKWEHYSRPQIKRAYSLFGKMANVRNDNRHIDPLNFNKGIPEDITSLTFLELNDLNKDCYHNHAWLNQKEIEKLTEWYELYSSRNRVFFENDCIHCYLFGKSFYDYPREEDEYKIQDVRFIYWFDN